MFYKIAALLNKITGARFCFSVTVTYLKKGTAAYTFDSKIFLVDRRHCLSRKSVGDLFRKHFHDSAKNNRSHGNGNFSYDISYLGWFKPKKGFTER